MNKDFEMQFDESNPGFPSVEYGSNISLFFLLFLFAIVKLPTKS